MRYQFYTADVFTDRIFGGNPLAVFPYAEGLNPQQMQQIAKEFNLSETVFVFPPENPNYYRRLRIFTPEMEVPFAGHPTIGSAYILATIGPILIAEDEANIIFEEGVGAVSVKIIRQNNQQIYAELKAAQFPEFGPKPPTIDQLGDMIGLDPVDLVDSVYYPEAVSCGLPFLFIPLVSRQALARARLNYQIWQSLLSSYWAPHVYVFTKEVELAGSTWRARMFAPGAGVEEDPATGSAATAFAGYISSRNSITDGTCKWVIEQGFEMGRPSLLYVEADKKNNSLTEIRVGGNSVMVSEGWINIT